MTTTTTMQRRVLVVAGAVLAAAALWLVMRPQALRVDVATVRRAPLRVTVDEEGETRVRDRYVVAAPATGRLLRIEHDEGDPIEAGAVVARIEPAPLDPRDRAAAQARLEAAESSQQAARARMQRAEAALAQARRDAARAAQLHARGTASDYALEQARLAETSAVREHEEARFAAAAAASDVEAARAVLIADPGPTASRPEAAAAPSCAGAVPCLEGRAPVSGQILRVLEESERIVAAGTPLVEIGDPAALEIVTDVLSRDAVGVTAGTPVWIEDWGGPGALEGRVRRVEPSGFTKVSALGVEEQRVNVVIDLAEPDPRLGDGYRVEVRIVTWEGDDVLQIPASALFRVGPQWAVFVVEGGRARRRPVEVGAQATFDVEIRAGLSEGDVVILHPSDRLDDGTRVAPR
ncbi:MAG: HlyD family efflux transporter periplasmic adaptor subunit [Myxococcota bacterium]|nr:HlyD family efflux transporter periplasmic adaptor subunit [Myxococcota bacterium]